MTELRSIAMAMVVFAALVTGMLSFSGGVFNQYGSGVVNSTQYSAVQEVEENLTSTRETYIGENKNQTEDITQDIEQDTFFITSVAQGVTNIYTAGSVMISSISNLGSETADIPPWFTAMITSLLLIAMIWGILRFTFS